MIQYGTDYWLGGLDADRDKGLQWMSGAKIPQFITSVCPKCNIPCFITDLAIFTFIYLFTFIPFLSNGHYPSAGAPMEFRDFKNNDEPAGNPFLHMNFDDGFR